MSFWKERIEFFGKKLRGGRVKMLNPFHFPQFFQDDDEHTVHTSFRTTAKLTPVSVASFLRMRGLRRWAPLRVPDPMPEMDALIAATAIIHDLTLVTHNTKDFERTGIRLLDPRR